MSVTIRRFILVPAIAFAMLALAATANATPVTYTNSDVPKSIAEGGTANSVVTVPAGRPPITDVDVVNIQLLAASNAADQQLSLTPPAPPSHQIVNLGCASYTPGTNLTHDQQAPGNPFGGAGTCPPGTGTYKPSTSVFSSTPLADAVNNAASGTWTLQYHDSNVSGTGGTLNGWGLRLTYEPLTITAKADAQKLKKTLLIRDVFCNANCSLTTGGDAKPATFAGLQNKPQSLRVSLTKKARKRLAEKGNARIALTADSGYGDVVTETVKVKIKRK
jgi:hypothetical protein